MHDYFVFAKLNSSPRAADIALAIPSASYDHGSTALVGRLVLVLHLLLV